MSFFSSLYQNDGSICCDFELNIRMIEKIFFVSGGMTKGKQSNLNCAIRVLFLALSHLLWMSNAFKLWRSCMEECLVSDMVSDGNYYHLLNAKCPNLFGVPFQYVHHHLINQ